MIKYRPEIDGLRAIAILFVILFHAGFKLFNGGFIGVDIFFVISGYLITSNIYPEIIEKRFSLLGFYERRIRRIIPILFIVCLASVVLAWIFLTPSALYNFGNSLLGLAIMRSNIYFAFKNNYFEEPFDFSPLIHTWSLSIEEQFYIVFPILLLLSFKFYKSGPLKVIIFLISISLIYSIYLVNIQSDYDKIGIAFFLLKTRIWELGFGALVAILKHSKQEVADSRINNIRATFGLLLILLPLFLLDNNTPFPGIAAIGPTLGTSLLLYYATNKVWVCKILSFKPLVYLGMISYSLYLWHQVLFAFWRNINLSHEISMKMFFILLFLSIVLSVSSFKLIENPFRKLNFLKQKTVFILGLLSLFILASAGYVSTLATFKNEDWLAYKLSKANSVYFNNISEREFLLSRLKYELKEVKTIVMGSSRLMQVGSQTMKKDVLNISISSATIEEYIALIPEVINKVNASEIYIGVEPWMTRRTSSKKVPSIYSKFLYWNDAISQGNTLISSKISPQVKQNLVLSPIQELYTKVNRSVIYPSSSNVESMQKKTNDGFHIYDERYVNKSQSEIINGFDQAINYIDPNLRNDLGRLKQLKSFIMFLQHNKITVHLVLSPFHPELYKRIKKDKPKILEMEETFKNIAIECNIKIFGSYNPEKNQCEVSDFYDGMHPKESGMIKILHVEK